MLEFHTRPYGHTSEVPQRLPRLQPLHAEAGLFDGVNGGVLDIDPESGVHTLLAIQDSLVLRPSAVICVATTEL